MPYYAQTDNCSSCGKETNAPQDSRDCKYCGDVVIRCFVCYRRDGEAKATCAACRHMLDKDD